MPADHEKHPRASRDEARRIAATEGYRQSRKYREKVEILFAHLKRILRLDKLRLLGFSGARDEFLFAATAQNLRRIGVGAHISYLMRASAGDCPVTVAS